MTDKIKTVISDFISTHWDGISPLLLALSGGPDSRLLLEILLEIRCELKFELAVAHVDHRWRPASAGEAQILDELAKKSNLTFHLKVLSPKSLKGNLEAACRNERLAFFKSLCQTHHYQAVFLGHHAGDQVETVIKKLFEGVSLPYLTGLSPVKEIDGLTLWRPLLEVSKEKITSELNKRSILAFEDETNQNPQFLRARLRTRLLPLLTKEFGKEISSHLIEISQEAFELQAYLSDKMAPLLKTIAKGPFGSLLDLKDHKHLETIELKHLVRLFCQDANLPLSKSALHSAAHFLKEGSAAKSISSGKSLLQIDRGKLFATSARPPKTPASIELTVGEHLFEGWKVTVQTPTKDAILTPYLPSCSNLLSAWQGKCHVILPLGESPYHLAMPSEASYYRQTSSLRKWWNNAKTPAFLRPCFPVITDDNCVIHEFLSGKNPSFEPHSKQNITINLNWTGQD